MENIQKNFQSLINHMEEQREQFKITTTFLNRAFSELVNQSGNNSELVELIRDQLNNLYWYMEDFNLSNIREGMEKDSGDFKKELPKNIPFIFTPTVITDYMEKNNIKF